MKYFDDVLEKQAHYEKLRFHKKMVNKSSNTYNEFEQYAMDNLDGFLQSVYDMAMGSSEIKLSGVFIR